MSKKHKKKPSASGLPAVALLRPRLDALWGQEALARKEDSAVRADLDAMARGVRPDALFLTMLQAYLAAPAESQARLDAIVPGWLRERGHQDTLTKIAADVSLAGDLQERALAWLMAAGVETSALARPPQTEMFYRAYFYEDDSQATLHILWYTDARKTHVRGFNFLIDYNPPWDGAVKDIIFYPQRTPQGAIKDFIEIWNQRGMRLKSITAMEAKQKALKALDCNRKSNIRLPRDLIAARQHLIRQVLSLPDGPNTPTITTKDIDFLCRNGQRPEEIMRFEQTVGRRVRMKDGKEIIVMGHPPGFDEEW